MFDKRIGEFEFNIWWFREKSLILYGEKRKDDEEHKIFFTFLPFGAFAFLLEGAGVACGRAADAEAVLRGGNGGDLGTAVSDWHSPTIAVSIPAISTVPTRTNGATSSSSRRLPATGVLR